MLPTPLKIHFQHDLEDVLPSESETAILLGIFYGTGDGVITLIAEAASNCMAPVFLVQIPHTTTT